MMRNHPSLLPIGAFFLITLALVLGCSFSTGDAFIKVLDADEEVSEEKEAEEPEEPEPEEDSFTIRSNPSGAAVYFNNRYVGTTPVELLDLAPGSYKVALELDGYYDTVTWVNYGGGTKSVRLVLDAIKGTIAVRTYPENAEIVLGGESISPGLTEVPIGGYRLTARAFGYEESTLHVEIFENRTTFVDVVLDEAPFRLSDPKLSRRSFNPDNPGLLGKTRFSFQVSDYGSGAVEIIDSNGNTVLEKTLPPFTTWEQSYLWNGRGEKAQNLPDGRYTIRVIAVGEEEPSGTPHTAEREVSLDRSITIAYRSNWSGTPGLLYAGMADVLPLLSFQVSTLFLGHAEQNLYRVPIALSGRIGLSREMELALLAGLIMEDITYLPLIFSGSFRYRYLGAQSRNGLQMAVSGKVTYQHGTGTDTFSNFTGVSVGNITQLTLRPLTLVFFPEIILSPWRVTYDASYDDVVALYPWLYLRAGLMLDFGAVVTGLSAAVRTLPLDQGFGIDFPVEGGFEFHAMIPMTQLFLSFGLAAEVWDIDSWYLMGGGGIGYLF